ncbi:NADPH-dependent FMN and FAD-containing oxidoreductase [Hyphodiscus hymeniophilus]|uniref:NADPH-dependent diflavin oxidoreductase 1 n=1 Tax=Hyphodiscus hymeniophilus TaxID=353542 RepID=A0A9P6VM03_9HELO|nr:NADPH-dependent FMN and FAD-containing oxidoreductase [Hyphodiscus hymeniophilus]
MSDNASGQRHDRTALILYGSETGNSQDTAEELGRMAERLHFLTRVAEMDAVEIGLLLKYSVVILVVSTTGQGEFPTNARKFWKSLLRKRLLPGCLNHVPFTTFGIGDSSYSKFNWAARKLHKRLEQLGANEIYPRGEADEQHEEGIDGTFLSWSLDLKRHLLASFPLPEGVEPIPQEVLLPAKFTLRLLETTPDQDSQSEQDHQLTSISNGDSSTQHTNNNLHSTKPEPEDPTMLYLPPPEPNEPAVGPQLKDHLEDLIDPVSTLIPSCSHLPIPGGFSIELMENKRVTPLTHWQDVRLLTFRMTADEHQYEPGDVVTIFPKNFADDVQGLIDLMGWNLVADKPLKFELTGPDLLLDPYFAALPPGLYARENSTLRQLLTHNLDFTAIPKPSFFRHISHYTDDQRDKERLLEFGDSRYRDEYYDYATRPRRSILEILTDFTSVKIPFNEVASIFPVIRGRQFSICSGGLGRQVARPAHQDRKTPDEFIKVQLLVAIVKYQTVLKRIRQGLCSRYIASLQQGMHLTVKLDGTGSFYKIPDLFPEFPVIMVAAGTGVAPCRSLIWERAGVIANRDLDDDSKPVGPNVLIYGGRNKKADFFFKNEMTGTAMRTKVLTAFSRDQKEKVYVQDVIMREGKMLVELILQRGVVYVCGSSGNMPKAVRQAFLRALVEFGGPGLEKNMDNAEKCLAEMEKTGHYIQETW